MGCIRQHALKSRDTSLRGKWCHQSSISVPISDCLHLAARGRKASLPPHHHFPSATPLGRILLQYLQRKILGQHPDRPGLGQPACPVAITVACGTGSSNCLGLGHIPILHRVENEGAGAILPPQPKEGGPPSEKRVLLPRERGEG